MKPERIVIVDSVGDFVSSITIPEDASSSDAVNLKKSINAALFEIGHNGLLTESLTAKFDTEV